MQIIKRKLNTGEYLIFGSLKLYYLEKGNRD